MTANRGSKAGWIILAGICLLLVGGLVFSFFRPGLKRNAQPAQHQAQSGTDDEKPQAIVITKPPLPPSDYVGTAACAECHSKIAAQYANHSMAHSAAEILKGRPVEDFGEKATFAADERHFYAVEKTASGMNHHERLLSAEGEVLYDQSVPVHYEIGSGAHGKSYLLQQADTLFMSPITWYSKSARWNLSPGYKMPVHRRFERRIVNDCVDCHVGRVNYVRGEDNHFGKPLFLELPIGCERCHGPGGRHVKHHRDAIPTSEVDPIVNPSKLDPARREDVCAQCHLQGEGRIPNYGCEIGDYRPGQRLEETLIIFVKGTRTTPDGKSRAVSHVEQMRSSKCYQSSNGKFGCTSCHDPHSLPSARDKVTFYREKCLTCHQQQGCSLPLVDRQQRQADDSCVACHMPPIGASDIPHTSHTDHRVLKFQSKLLPDTAPGNALPEIYDHAEQRLPEWMIIRARGLWLADHAEVNTDSEMANLALKLLFTAASQLPPDADILDAQGTAAAVAGRFTDSMSFWKRTLDLEPRREFTLRTLALTLYNTKHMEEAVPYIKRYLEIQPWNSSMWARYSHLLGQQGKWKEALEAAKKTENIDPSAPRVYQWLGEIYRQLGDAEKNEHYDLLYERVKVASEQDSGLPDPMKKDE